MALHGGSSVAGVGGIPALASGTYTPTLTGVANIAGSTPYLCQYMRVGNVVTVSGKMDIQATATTTITRLGISLPIPSALTTDYQVGGTVSTNGAHSAGPIYGDIPGDRAELSFISANTLNMGYYFSFTYQVL